MGDFQVKNEKTTPKQLPICLGLVSFLHLTFLS